MFNIYSGYDSYSRRLGRRNSTGASFENILAGGKGRDGRRLKNDLSYNLVMGVVIHCASPRGGKHEEHLVPCGLRASGWNFQRTSTYRRLPRERRIDRVLRRGGRTGAWHAGRLRKRRSWKRWEGVVRTLVASPCRARWGLSRITRRSPYNIQTILTTNNTSPSTLFSFSLSLFSFKHTLKVFPITFPSIPLPYARRVTSQTLSKKQTRCLTHELPLLPLSGSPLSPPLLRPRPRSLPSSYPRRRPSPLLLPPSPSPNPLSPLSPGGPLRPRLRLRPRPDETGSFPSRRPLSPKPPPLPSSLTSPFQFQFLLRSNLGRLSEHGMPLRGKGRGRRRLLRGLRGSLVWRLGKSGPVRCFLFFVRERKLTPPHRFLSYQRLDTRHSTLPGKPPSNKLKPTARPPWLP